MKLILTLLGIALYLGIAECQDTGSSRSWRWCYVCSGKYPDRECELYPKYVSKGPGQINCTRNFCTTYVRYKPKKYLLTFTSEGKLTAARTLTPKDYDVNSIARECADVERGNTCESDVDDMGITCYTTCQADLCNDVTRSPAWDDFRNTVVPNRDFQDHKTTPYQLVEDGDPDRNQGGENELDYSYGSYDTGNSNNYYDGREEDGDDPALYAAEPGQYGGQEPEIDYAYDDGFEVEGYHEKTIGYKVDMSDDNMDKDMMDMDVEMGQDLMHYENDIPGEEDMMDKDYDMLGSDHGSNYGEPGETYKASAEKGQVKSGAGSVLRQSITGIKDALRLLLPLLGFLAIVDNILPKWLL